MARYRSRAQELSVTNPPPLLFFVGIGGILIAASVALVTAVLSYGSPPLTARILFAVGGLVIIASASVLFVGAARRRHNIFGLYQTGLDIVAFLTRMQPDVAMTSRTAQLPAVSIRRRSRTLARMPRSGPGRSRRHEVKDMEESLRIIVLALTAAGAYQEAGDLRAAYRSVGGLSV